MSLLKHALFAVSALALLGCGNPSIDPKITALGGEVPGVEPSEYHRPGQPCLLCHGPYYGKSPYFAIAGTVFAKQEAQMKNLVPVDGAIVHVTDSFGETRDLTANCIGNFMINADDWQPAFPLQVSIDCPVPGEKGLKARSMNTRIGRDGSCAGCHFGPASATSPGWVTCIPNGSPSPYVIPTHASCPGIP
jgi:hypothetical protein